MFLDKPHRKSPHNNRGFTLLEVLITIIIIAIGLLGMAGLQVATLKNNNSSSMRTQATFLAEGMADRIRTNQAALDPNNDGSYADSLYVGQDTSAVTNPGCIASAAGCTTSQLRDFDMFEWLAGRDLLLDKIDGIDSLPSGRGQISYVPDVGANPGNILRIRVMWDDERTGAIGTACGLDPAVDLTCFDLEFHP